MKIEVFFPPNAGMHDVYDYCRAHNYCPENQAEIEIHLRPNPIFPTELNVKEVESIVVLLS